MSLITTHRPGLFSMTNQLKWFFLFAVLAHQRLFLIFWAVPDSTFLGTTYLVSIILSQCFCVLPRSLRFLKARHSVQMIITQNHGILHCFSEKTESMFPWCSKDITVWLSERWELSQEELWPSIQAVHIQCFASKSLSVLDDTIVLDKKFGFFFP